VSDHDIEYTSPEGLPAPLPAGERLLWQGKPEWQAIARRVLHVRKLALYFGVLLAASVGARIGGGESVANALVVALWLAPLALAVLAIATVIAWLMGRTTLYTITDRRVVMKVGVVLTITYNLPFKAIESAALRSYADGTADIALILAADTRLAYVHLWPHARPWRVSRPEPMLRMVPDGERVAALLSRALAASAPGSVRTAASSSAGTGSATVEPHPLATAN
jgi:hypothetical protein